LLCVQDRATVDISGYLGQMVVVQQLSIQTAHAGFLVVLFGLEPNLVAASVLAGVGIYRVS
jgi:hypothetical protein